MSIRSKLKVLKRSPFVVFIHRSIARLCTQHADIAHSNGSVAHPLTHVIPSWWLLVTMSMTLSRWLVAPIQQLCLQSCMLPISKQRALWKNKVWWRFRFGVRVVPRKERWWECHQLSNQEEWRRKSSRRGKEWEKRLKGIKGKKRRKNKKKK